MVVLVGVDGRGWGSGGEVVVVVVVALVVGMLGVALGGVAGVGRGDGRVGGVACVFYR